MCSVSADRFRTRQDVDLIRTGAGEAVVGGSFELGGAGGAWHREVTVHVRKDRAREIRVDGSRVADRAEVVGAVPCILFSHDDLRAVDGPPAELRRFFDQTAALSDPTALPALRRYRRVLMETQRAAAQRGRRTTCSTSTTGS